MTNQDQYMDFTSCSELFFFIRVKWLKWLWSLRILNGNLITSDLNLNLGQPSWSFCRAETSIGIDSLVMYSEILQTLFSNTLYQMLFCTAANMVDWFPTESELQLVTISYKYANCTSDPKYQSPDQLLQNYLCEL